MTTDLQDGRERIHRATSDDGTEIVGSVHGEGPPLVLFHGGLTDGEHAWAELLPSLTDRFTCYLPSMRGTGLSEDHEDQRPERHAEDLAAYIDSIGVPVGLVGHSTGGTYSFAAAQMGATVSAMATYEPAVFEFWEEGEDAKRFEQAAGRMAEAAADGRLTDGARYLLSVFANDEEISIMEEKGAFDHAGQYVPKLLEIFEQAPQTEAPNPNDPSELAGISIPVLLLHGSRTTEAHAESVYYLDEQLLHSEVREIPGLGHMAPELGAEAVANELIDFFEATLASD